MQTCTSTISTGPCPPTVAGPYAAWMPRKRLQGRTCSVSRDGGRARGPCSQVADQLLMPQSSQVSHAARYARASDIKKAGLRPPF
ncbi:hypothetical protein XaplCFBP3123_14285 [Xanthomonas arboricola pv. populi]|nr:hypothetical protein XaplCFBP3123_14285 [Xanthomonas arboricola pv. populi]